MRFVFLDQSKRVRVVHNAASAHQQVTKLSFNSLPVKHLVLILFFKEKCWFYSVIVLIVQLFFSYCAFFLRLHLIRFLLIAHIVIHSICAAAACYLRHAN